MYESVIPYLLLVSAINLELFWLYCFTLDETSLRLSLLTCLNKLWKVATTRPFNCSVNTCSAIFSVLRFVRLTMLPKYDAPGNLMYYLNYFQQLVYWEHLLFSFYVFFYNYLLLFYKCL